MPKTTLTGAARRAGGIPQSEVPPRSESSTAAAQHGATDEQGTPAGTSQGARLAFSLAQRPAAKPAGGDVGESDDEHSSDDSFKSAEDHPAPTRLRSRTASGNSAASGAESGTSSGYGGDRESVVDAGRPVGKRVGFAGEDNVAAIISASSTTAGSDVGPAASVAVAAARAATKGGRQIDATSALPRPKATRATPASIAQASELSRPGILRKGQASTIKRLGTIISKSAIESAREAAIDSDSGLEDLVEARLGKRAQSLRDIGGDLDLAALRELADVQISHSSDDADVSDGGPAARGQALRAAITALEGARSDTSDVEEIPLRELRQHPLRRTMRDVPPEQVVEERIGMTKAVGNLAVQVLKDYFLRGAGLTIAIAGGNYIAKALVPHVDEASELIKTLIVGGTTAAAIAGPLYAMIKLRISKNTDLLPSPRTDISNAFLTLSVAASAVANYYAGTFSHPAGDATRAVAVQVLRALVTTAISQSTNRSEHDSRSFGTIAGPSAAIATFLGIAYQTSQQTGAYGGSSQLALTGTWSDAIVPLTKNAAIYGFVVEGAITAFIDTMDSLSSRYLPGEELTTAARAARDAGQDPAPSFRDLAGTMKVSADPKWPVGKPLDENFVDDSSPVEALAMVLNHMSTLVALAATKITSDPTAQGQIQAALNAVLVAAMLPAVISASDRSKLYKEGSTGAMTVRSRQNEVDAGDAGTGPA